MNIALSWERALEAYRSNQLVSFFFHERFPQGTRPRTVIGRIREIIDGEERDGGPRLVVEDDFHTVTVRRDHLRALAIYPVRQLAPVPRNFRAFQWSARHQRPVTLHERGSGRVFRDAKVRAIFPTQTRDEYLVDFEVTGVRYRMYAVDLEFEQR